MTEKSLIKKEDEICLLEDDERVFLIEQGGAYMSPSRMVELASKMLSTAEIYCGAIEAYNSRRDAT